MNSHPDQHLLADESALSYRVGLTFQLQRSPLRVSSAKCRAMIYEHLDETISIGFGPSARTL